LEVKLGLEGTTLGFIGGGVLDAWPLHNIVFSNILWCVAYKKAVEGGRILPNGRAIALQQLGNAGGKDE